MQIQLISDAHLNSNDHLNFGNSFSVVNPKADVLVIAGDMVSSPKVAKGYISSFREQTDVPVIYVLGNHEYYDFTIPEALDKYKEAVKSISDVHLLEKERIELQGVTFLGTTLWSDLSDPLAALAVSQALSDYQFIKKNDKTACVTSQDLHTEHVVALSWLKTALSATQGKTVVVTHHAPCWACRDTQFDYDKNSQWITAGFCNRLDTLIYQSNIDYWLYGHTHRSLSYNIHNTKIVSNQVGYQHETKHSGFNRDWLLTA